MNKNKKVRFAKAATSSSNTPNQVDSHKIQDSNKPVLPSTGMKSSTSASRSQRLGNTKKNRFSRTTSSYQKNKVEDQPRSVKSNSNKKNLVIEPVCNANVKHIKLNVYSELIYVKCNQCMFDSNHDVCFLEFVNDVNVRSKSKSAKRSKKKNFWKPTRKVFTDIRYRWKPTGWTFTIVRNMWPLTRITSTKVVPLKETTSKLVITQNPKVKVYSRRPKVTKSVGSSSKSKIIESRISNNSEPNQSWGSNAFDVPSSSLVDFRFEIDQITKIMAMETIRWKITDNGTEFVNQTLRAYNEDVRISHQTSVARTPQQNGVVERWNQTLLEAARTMLIFSKALLFL
ncbi:retrovirus-related pol polyprotein from transposon TNT 1-94 [Tanacetum coccineum]